jgi:hypothetical protein
VSKNEVGDRRTAFKAALKRFKLANKDMILNVNISFIFMTRVLITKKRTHAKVKLNMKVKLAIATPKKNQLVQKGKRKMKGIEFSPNEA